MVDGSHAGRAFLPPLIELAALDGSSRFRALGAPLPRALALLVGARVPGGPCALPQVLLGARRAARDGRLRAIALARAAARVDREPRGARVDRARRLRARVVRDVAREGAGARRPRERRAVRSR